MQYISSPSNSFIKELKKIVHSSRYAREKGMSAAEGIHLGRELLKCPQLIQKVVLRTEALKNPEIEEIVKALPKDIEIVEVPPHIFNQVSPVETSTGILCLISLPQARPIIPGEDCVYLDGVQDPGNAGTIIRTAAAAGVRQIISSPSSAWLWSPKVLRAAMGAHFIVGIHCGMPLKDAASQCGNEVLVADARGGKDLFLTPWGEKATMWVFGSEGTGVTKEALEEADKILLIPLDPQVESLNVAIAASVCLFEQKRRRLVQG